MSAPTPLQALRVPGVLVVNPTTNPPVDAVPHGGVQLGLVRDVVLRRTERRFELVGEEYGGEVLDHVYLGETWAIVFALRGLDNEALRRLFPTSATPTPSQREAISWPGSGLREGRSREVADGVALLFSPDDPDHHAVYFRRAIPLVAQELDLALGREEELLVLAGFLATRDGTTADGSVQVALREDLAL